jgi:hypothetical protein
MNKDKQEKEYDNIKNDREKSKREFVTYKYSQAGKRELNESIIINGFPFFIRYDIVTKQHELVKNIEETSRNLRPPNREEYPYPPYEFGSKEELDNFIEKAEKTSLDEIYIKCKSIFLKYIDQDIYIITLLAADSIWTYFQDLFPATHYCEGVGANDVGKSSIGYTFEYTGYRVIKGTAISGANYSRILGVIEPGQCVIIEDEGDSISEDSDKIRILKSGYEYNGKIPKINMNMKNQEQQWYKPYGYKMILAEKSLSQSKAKGLVDRTFSFNCRPGKVELSIKEVVSENINKNIKLQQLSRELLDYRKLLLCYRLIHYKDQLVEIETGLKNRDNELCKPLLQLFYGTKALQEIINSLEVFVNQRRERKSNTIEAVLYPILKEIIKEQERENNQEQEDSEELFNNNNNNNTISSDSNKFIKITFSKIWRQIVQGGIYNTKGGIDGNYDEKKPNQYETVDYGILYKNTISKLIADKFGAKLHRKADGSTLIFYLDKFRRFNELYGQVSSNNISQSTNTVKIKVKPLEIEKVDHICNDNSTKNDVGNVGSHQNDEGICARNEGNECNEGITKFSNSIANNNNNNNNNNNDNDIHNTEVEKKNSGKSLKNDISINGRDNNTHQIEPTPSSCLHHPSLLPIQLSTEPTQQPTLLKKSEVKGYTHPLISESDLSVGGPFDLDIINTIDRFEGRDRWFCNNCTAQGDKWFMMKHPCSNNKKK